VCQRHASPHRRRGPYPGFRTRSPHLCGRRRTAHNRPPWPLGSPAPPKAQSAWRPCHAVHLGPVPVRPPRREQERARPPAQATAGAGPGRPVVRCLPGLRIMEATLLRRQAGGVRVGSSITRWHTAERASSYARSMPRATSRRCSSVRPRRPTASGGLSMAALVLSHIPACHYVRLAGAPREHPGSATAAALRLARRSCCGAVETTESTPPREVVIRPTNRLADCTFRSRHAHSPRTNTKILQSKADRAESRLRTT